MRKLIYILLCLQLSSWAQTTLEIPYGASQKVKGYLNFVGSSVDSGCIRKADSVIFHWKGTNNIFVGQRTKTISVTTGKENTAMGRLAGTNIAGGINNSVFGSNAGAGITSGGYNTMIGMYAGATTSTVSFNTFGGYSAGYRATVGGNTAFGAYAYSGASGANGTYNVAVGYQPLFSATSCENNIAIGKGALYTATTGGNSTVIGFEAGYLTTGSYNNYFGRRAGYNETGSYKTYIAHDSTSWANGMATASKLMWYSDASNADKANHFINLFGKVAIGEAKALSAYSLEVVGNANITTSCTLGTFLQLTPTADPPGSPSEGMIYADTDHHIYYYNGSTWVQLDN